MRDQPAPDITRSYRMLIDRQFVVGKRTYTVCDVVCVEDQILVEAATGKARKLRQFPLEKVVQSLLVEEEIELYQPNFLGVSGTG